MTEPQEVERERPTLDLLLRGFQVSACSASWPTLELLIVSQPMAIGILMTSPPTAGFQPQALIRVLRALASLAIFRVTPDGKVAHTPHSLLLRVGETNSLHHAARFWAAAGAWEAWGKLDVALDGRVPHRPHGIWVGSITCVLTLTRHGCTTQ